MYIPEGFGTIFPYFIVKDALRYSDFLKNAFDARELGRSVMSNGRVANIRVGIGTSNFMISEEQDGFGATKGVFYIYVKNADESFARALSYGATKIMEPMDMPYEDRQGGVTDPFGNQWWISTRLVQEPYD
jgi:uncharacterized glyoxalase superfamily protein PhnB